MYTSEESINQIVMLWWWLGNTEHEEKKRRKLESKKVKNQKSPSQIRTWPGTKGKSPNWDHPA